ncbi:JmjC domain-containing protein [Shewanella intestini]|uniref:Cupin domain-containing protein n=1 Tax=Shewanella intestini TaxID=2017544 RepID=A0ABS5I3A9_9GAMM|nr:MULTISPECIES: cupin domain-containing protein [Shewanella]MBR9727820.1 cupin domain-containing protein [Shewanella intestini]MRG36187.1 cupin domain-containing protein [Shewanella sp. XMDDZSB0408]
MYQLTFDKAEFLKTTWQKKPVILKGAFKNFQDPISADELAGLAFEEEVSSRIVVTKPEGWDVIHGPFEDYSQYGEQHWQLLVQAVNHWYPESQPMVEAFRFIPDWRFDDLMVSFATPNGGVGPHIDNYDVFIIQGEGRRRWRVGDLGQYQQRDNNPNSPLIEDFVPIIDDILETGDILYIPPGFPHCGETLTTAISYSMGFRAPSQQEVLTELADYFIDNNEGQQRFTSTQEPEMAGVVPTSHQQGIMALLASLANDPQAYQTMLGKLLSKNRFELDVCEIDAEMDAETLIDALEHGAQLLRIGGLKVLCLEGDNQSRLFVNGEMMTMPNSQTDILNTLTQQVSFTAQQATDLISQSIDCVDYFVSMLKQGYYYLSE